MSRTWYFENTWTLFYNIWKYVNYASSILLMSGFTMCSLYIDFPISLAVPRLFLSSFYAFVNVSTDPWTFISFGIALVGRWKCWSRSSDLSCSNGFWYSSISGGFSCSASLCLYLYYYCLVVCQLVTYFLWSYEWKFKYQVMYL